MASQDPDNSWHLDKRVPIALIVTLMMQGAIGIWWMASLGSRVDYLERGVSASSGLGGDIIQMKEQLRGIEKTLVRLESYLDKRAEKSSREVGQ